MSIYDRDWYREDYSKKDKKYNGDFSLKSKPVNGNKKKVKTSGNKRFKKFFFSVILLGYVYALYKVFILSPNVVKVEGTGFYVLRVYSELIENENTDFFRSVGIIIASMIPVGFLYPLSKGKRCIGETMTFGAFLGTLCEILQFVFNCGSTCYDDILYATFGAWIGYKLFVYACRHTSDGFSYIWPADEKPKKGLLLYLFLVVMLFSIWVNYNNGTLGETAKIPDINTIKPTSDIEKTEEKNNVILPETTESVYETILTAMRSHQKSYRISGVTGFISSDDIYSQFRKVLDDHPELFWLSGGSTGSHLTSGPLVTYTIYPTMNCDISGVPAKEQQLEDVVNTVVQMAQIYDSDYDKALFVHDYIVLNCEYDVNTYYYSLYASNDTPIVTHAYDCYGCLVEHTAVCAGYSKAYKLILNRLGIECDVVTGEGYNSMGNGAHAWNRVTIDGEQYYVDVTWDDPVTNGYVLDTVPRDYFMLSYDEISRDHHEE